MLYELRIYVSSPENVDALHERFRTVNLGVFERLGIDLVGFWTDVTDPVRIHYLVRFPDQAARDAAWAAFDADPEWQAAKKESEDRHGKLVLQAISTRLEPTAYSPLQ